MKRRAGGATLPFIRDFLSLLKVLLLSPHIQVDNKKHLNQKKLQGCLGRERESNCLRAQSSFVKLEVTASLVFLQGLLDG